MTRRNYGIMRGEGGEKMAEYLKIKENADWYYANLDSLLPKYRGRFGGYDIPRNVGGMTILV